MVSPSVFRHTVMAIHKASDPLAHFEKAVALRKAYLTALETASVGEDIKPFAEFLARLVEKRLAGEPLPEVPKTSA